ncbi:acyl-CoA thioesterase II [Frankia sp. B2]|nr:acyl-CoA thioesterase II [Frankia sp. CgIM4]TFE33173.1 acyl-CoA thioesterase II [Frankia sp. B2]
MWQFARECSDRSRSPDLDVQRGRPARASAASAPGERPREGCAVGTQSAETTDARAGEAPKQRASTQDQVDAVPAPGQCTLSELLAVLDLGGDVPPVPARCLPSTHGGVLGAQLLGQQIVLAERMTPNKITHSLQTVFMRPGDCRQPVWIDVERLAHGRSIDSLALTFRQDSLQICRADVMLRSPEPDFLRLRSTESDFLGPQHASPLDRPMMPWEVRVLPRADTHQLDQWQRIPEAPEDRSLWRAFIAHSCELLPLSDLLAVTGLTPTKRLAVAVLSQNVTFYDDLDVRDWHLFRVRTLHAGHGRAIGRVEVFGPDGELRAGSELVGLLRGSAI